MTKDTERGNTPPSRFSAALANVFRAMDVPNKTWARWLGVTEGAVSQWTTDACAPSPRNIYRIVAILRDARDHLDSTAIREFEDVLSADASAITPNGARMGSTIGSYMLKPLRESLLSALETLPTRAQEELLLASIEICTRLKRSGADTFDLFESVEKRQVLVTYEPFRKPEESAEQHPGVSDLLAQEGDLSPEGLRELLAPEGLKELLATIACEMYPILTRLAEKPTSPRAARESLWKLAGCGKFADALDESACTEPVLSWAAEAMSDQHSTERLLGRLRDFVYKSLRAHHKRYALESEVARALDQAANVKTLFLVEANVRDRSVLHALFVQSRAKYPTAPEHATGSTAFWCEREPQRVESVRPLGQFVVAHRVLTKWSKDQASPPVNGIELLQSTPPLHMLHAAEPLVESLRQAEDPWEALRDSGPELLGHTVNSLPQGVAEKPTLVRVLAKTLDSQLTFT